MKNAENCWWNGKIVLLIDNIYKSKYFSEANISIKCSKLTKYLNIFKYIKFQLLIKVHLNFWISKKKNTENMNFK